MGAGAEVPLVLPRARGAAGPTAAAARARSGAILSSPDIVAGSGCCRPPTSRGGMVPKQGWSPEGLPGMRVPVRQQLCASPGRTNAGGAGRSQLVRFWGLPKLPVPWCVAQPGLPLPRPYGSPRAGLRRCNLGPHRAVRKAVPRILTLHRTAARFGSGPL